MIKKIGLFFSIVIYSCLTVRKFEYQNKWEIGGYKNHCSLIDTENWLHNSNFDLLIYPLNIKQLENLQLEITEISNYYEFESLDLRDSEKRKLRWYLVEEYVAYNDRHFLKNLDLTINGLSPDFIFEYQIDFLYRFTDTIFDYINGIPYRTEPFDLNYNAPFSFSFKKLKKRGFLRRKVLGFDSNRIGQFNGIIKVNLNGSVIGQFKERSECVIH